MANSKLTDNEVRIASYIEQVFWDTGNVPTNEVVQEMLNVSPQIVTKAWKNEIFRQALVTRGINLNPDQSKGVLTPEQTMFANLLLNLHDKRSVREKLELLKQAGFDVSSQQYHAWMRDPAFTGYLQRRAETLFRGTNFQAYTAIISAIEDGDLNAVKLSFEMQGIYNPKIQVDVNVEAIVIKIVEIVSKHVTNSDTLKAIADEIELLGLNGSSQVPTVPLPASTVVEIPKPVFDDTKVSI